MVAIRETKLKLAGRDARKLVNGDRDKRRLFFLRAYRFLFGPNVRVGVIAVTAWCQMEPNNAKNQFQFNFQTSPSTLTTVLWLNR